MMRQLLGKGYVDPNFPNPNKSGDTDIIIYGYIPSLALAVAGAVSFFCCAVAAVGLLYRFRSASMSVRSFKKFSCQRLGFFRQK